MMALIIGMVLVTPVLACPPGQKCTGNCPTCVNNLANLKNIKKMGSTTINQDWQNALKSDDFKKLIKQLDSEGYQLNKTGVAGISATLNGTNYEAVGIPLVSKDNSTGVIAAVLENNKVIKVEAQIVKRDATGFPLSMKAETVTGKTIVTESANVSDLLNGETKESLSATASLGFMTSQAIDKCTACKQIVGVICNLGCYTEISLICILAGATTIIGGLVCGGIVTVMCYFTDWYGCAPGAAKLCRDAHYC